MSFSSIFCVIFRTVILIFIVVSCNNNVSAAVSSGLLQVSLVYPGMEMIQPGKSFLKFDCWSNKAFKKYEDVFADFFIDRREKQRCHCFSRLSIKNSDR